MKYTEYSLKALEEIKNRTTKASGWCDELISIECRDEVEIIEKALKSLKIIEEHKLLNYVLKNKKCASMYHLTDEEFDLLKEMMYFEVVFWKKV